MGIHREGTNTILLSSGLIALVAFLFLRFLPGWLGAMLCCVLIVIWIIIVRFFRVPKREVHTDGESILAPCDGKVVVIEKVQENEYFKDERIQVSIFMSPLNVHINYFPIAGTTEYVKYHPGKYLVAWHPKSSTENERATVVVKHGSGYSVLFRQIAGALARRICTYPSVGSLAEQGKEFGFIKFGSRVDVFLPTDAEVLVELDQKVTGAVTSIAKKS